MIHPTRTDLLQLKQKAVSMVNSVAILKARRHALIRTFLDSVRPFVRSRNAIRLDYGQALVEIHLSEGHEGMAAIESLAATAAREVGVTVEERNILGVRYRDLTIYGPFVRSPAERKYGYTLTSPHLEESIHLFESIVGMMPEIAAFESKVKMLGARRSHASPARPGSWKKGSCRGCEQISKPSSSTSANGKGKRISA